MTGGSWYLTTIHRAHFLWLGPTRKLNVASAISRSESAKPQLCDTNRFRRDVSPVIRKGQSKMGRLLVMLLLLAEVAFAQDSPHGPLRFECRECHSTDSWSMRKDASFDHAVVGFPLTGQHKVIDCVPCHAGLKFTALRSDCVSCHADVHKGELGGDCARCHSPEAWQIPDMVQKHQQTRFPLQGRHPTIDCQSCHSNAAQHQYAGTPTTCIGCHRSDYELTQAPNHIAAGFPTDCVKCHRVTALVFPQGFDHNFTAFPLTGAHRAVACNSCHTNQVYRSTPSECVACHLVDYVSTSSPNHLQVNFETTCENCHTTTRWLGAAFDHNRTRFPLTGGHMQLLCASCHGDNVFTGKSMECFSCHINAYNTVQDPNHLANGFAITCQNCHGTAAWRPWITDHDGSYFRIYSGAHLNTWGACSNCHHASAAYSDFTCVSCHQHSQSLTDPLHATVPGYVYLSILCYSCHSGV